MKPKKRIEILEALALTRVEKIGVLYKKISKSIINFLQK